MVKKRPQKKPEKATPSRNIKVGNVVDVLGDNPKRCMVSYVHAGFCDLIPFDGSEPISRMAIACLNKLSENVDEYIESL